MRGREFKTALKRVNLSIRGAGKFLGLSERTAYRIAAGDYEAPIAAAKLLRLMIRMQLTADDVDAEK